MKVTLRTVATQSRESAPVTEDIASVGVLSFGDYSRDQAQGLRSGPRMVAPGASLGMPMNVVRQPLQGGGKRRQKKSLTVKLWNLLNHAFSSKFA